MPIKGLSEIRRLPRLGMIRLGEKSFSKTTGKDYPKAVDYFVCPSEIKEFYGEKPKSLDIMFPVEDTEVFFPQFYKRYGATTGLLCKGDGETATVMENGQMREQECVPGKCEWYQKKHCKRVANLQFMLPKVPGLGVYQINTTSFYSILNINSALQMIKAVAGRVCMLPLQLVLKPQEVAPDGTKKIVHVMDLAVPITLEQLLSSSRMPLQEFLVPPVDDARPEDLYPDAILEPKKPSSDFVSDADKPVDMETGEILTDVAPKSLMYDELPF